MTTYNKENHMTYTIEDFEKFLERTGLTIDEVCEHTGYSRPGFNKYLYSGRVFNPRIVKSLEAFEKIMNLEQENRRKDELIRELQNKNQ
jgi:hypothetical protein